MKSLKYVLAALLLSTSVAATAGPITPGAGWYGFCFGNTNATTTESGQPAYDGGCLNEAVGTTGNSITFSLATGGILQVTDAFSFRDKFDVWINSVLAFTTGGGSYTGGFTENPDVAFSGGGYDKGSAILSAGNYSVDIFTNDAWHGGAYVQVLVGNVGVPEPGTLGLMALGLLGLASRRRKA